MKTLYVTDLDGTLLNTHDTINPYSIETINRLVERGMLFTYATARSQVSAAVVAKGRPLEDSGGLYDGKVFYFTIGERRYRKREKRMKTYKELYQAGEIEFEAIDDYSYEWGMSEDERTLAQYLGLNAEEEDAWVSIGEDALRELLDKGKKHARG